MKKCVFAGTFDPPTVGHEDVIKKCVGLFDEVVVAILNNTGKTCLFSLDDRLELLKHLCRSFPNVRVISFEGAIVDLLKREDTPYYVRGIRDGIDLDYENRNLYANVALMPEIVTLYVPASQSLTHVSSTLVKNSVYFKKEFDAYLPQSIKEEIYQKLENKNV